jgi:hypothetical protein
MPAKKQTKRMGRALIAVLCVMVVSSFAQKTNQPPIQKNLWPADRRSALEVMHKLDASPDCRNYYRFALSEIFSNCSVCDKIPSPRDTKILARFKLHQDGRISDVTISGDTNALVAPCCIKALKECPPLPKWPEKMRAIVGDDNFIIYIDFGYNMTPPGPG